MKRSPTTLLSTALLANHAYSLSSSAPPMKRRIPREFRWVPYGSPAPDGLENTISCDGRIPGTSLELTHWNGNETPDELYADTSTEMALNFATVQDEHDYLPNQEAPAIVLNNHFDTDGVLSVFACMEPDLALKHKDLIISAAEAGDFAEWTSDNGVKLNFALDSLLSSVDGSDEKAYDLALKELPGLVQDFDENEGANYEHLWKDSFQALQEDWHTVVEDKMECVSKAASSDSIVILNESEGLCTLSPHALYRAMKEKDIWQGTTRILHVHESSLPGKYQYSYEKIGHGWVNKLVQRHMVPNVVSQDGLVQELRTKLKTCWETGGPGDDMLAICASCSDVTVPPEEMAILLGEIEAKLGSEQSQA